MVVSLFSVLVLVLHKSLESSARRVAVEGALKQRADLVALRRAEGPRVPVGVAHREIGGAVQVLGTHADVLEGNRSAVVAGERLQAQRRGCRTERPRDSFHRAGSCL